MTITIEKNQKIQSLEIIDNVCVCDYTTEIYKKKMYYNQNNNSDVKTFEKPKHIKES